MITATVDATGLYRAMEEFSKASRKSMDEVLEQQAGIMVGHLIAFTPPAASRGQAINDRGTIAMSAKKRGEAIIRADIATLFPTTAIRDEQRIYGMIDNGFQWGTGRGKKIIRDFADSISDLARVHNFARSKATGRVRTGTTGQNMALTRKALRTAYTKEKIKDVGLLNAGWLRAAKKLKTAKRATPAWITRHGDKPGGVDFRRSKSRLTITVSNKMPYFPSNMESRIARAIDRRRHGLEQALEAMLARKAKRAEQRMNRSR